MMISTFCCLNSKEKAEAEDVQSVEEEEGS